MNTETQCEHKKGRCNWFWCRHFKKCFLADKDNDAQAMTDFIGIGHVVQTERQRNRMLKYWRVEIGKAKGENVEEKKVQITQVSKLDRKHHNCINPFCKSPTAHLTKHHLFPKPRTAEQSKRKIIICTDCHRLLHYLKSNRDLAKHYNTEKAVIGLFKQYEQEESNQENKTT